MPPNPAPSVDQQDDARPPADEETPSLPTEAGQAASFRRLKLFVRQAKGFRFAVALYNDPLVRNETIRSLAGELAGEGIRVLTLDLHDPSGERTLLGQLEAVIKSAVLAPAERFVVMLVNLETRIDYTPEAARAGGPGLAFLETANLHRDLLPAACPGPLIMWASESLESALVRYAPDLWRWRNHRFDFRVRRDHSAFAQLAGHRDLPTSDDRRHPEDRLRRLAEELAGYRQLVRNGHSEARFDESRILNTMGLARLQSGDARGARLDFNESLAIFREIGDRRGEGNALGNLGIAYKNLGEPRQAIGFYEQQLVIAREIGDRRGEGAELGNLGLAYAALGEPRQAIGFYEQQLVIAREIGDRRGEGTALYNLSRQLWEVGERRRALDCLEKSLLIQQETEDPWEKNVRARLEQYRSETQSGAGE